MLKSYHPDFSYKLWTEEDVTFDNFPQTYETVQNLMEFDRISPFSKMAAVADLLRIEILHRHGGFYFDGNFMPLKKGFLNNFLNYQMVAPGAFVGIHRIDAQNSFLGAAKGTHYTQRIIDQRMIATRNPFSRYTQMETGPMFVGRVFGDRQDPDLLDIPAEFVFPYDPWVLPKANNRCQAGRDTKKEDILFRKKRIYIKNCAEKYPYALAIKFFDEGGSWLYKKKV